MKREPYLWKREFEALPQNTDHAGVMWHGSYINWLEESRIDALSRSGLNYSELVKDGYELPVSKIDIKFLSPIHLGDKVTVESKFNITNSPKINIESKFKSKNYLELTKASIDIVLINKITKKILRKRPDYLSNVFQILNYGINF